MIASLRPRGRRQNTTCLRFAPGFAAVFLQSAGTRGTFPSVNTYGAETSPAAIATGDITGTGTTDFVVANFNTGSVSVMLQTSTPGVFTSGGQIG